MKKIANMFGPLSPSRTVWLCLSVKNGIPQTLQDVFFKWPSGISVKKTI